LVFASLRLDVNFQSPPWPSLLSAACNFLLIISTLSIGIDVVSKKIHITAKACFLLWQSQIPMLYVLFFVNLPISHKNLGKYCQYARNHQQAIFYTAAIFPLLLI
jgi:hypothetical protein